MCKTRHIQQRMSQRGIQQAMVDLVLNFGKTQGNKVILNRSGIDKVLLEIENIKQNALKARKKGGLVVVDIDGSLVTTYALDNNKYRGHRKQH